MFVGIATEEDELARSWLRRLSLREVQSGSNVWLATDARGGVHLDEHQVAVVAESPEAAARVAADYRAAGHRSLVGRDDDTSFILSDPHRALLIASSDLLSRTPLSYWSNRGTTVVSSRLVAMLRHPLVPKKIDDTYLAHVVTNFGCQPPGCTTIAGVRRLTAGQRLYVSAAGLRVATEARLRSRQPFGSSLEDVCAELRSVVADAVRRDASSHSCLALSGGLDSAVVGAVLAEQASELKAFSLVLAGSSSEGETLGIAAFERAFPNVVIRRVDASKLVDFPDLTSFELQDDPALPVLSLLPARLHMWRLAAEAGTPDMFDGEGGDELFSLWATALDALRVGDLRAAIRYVQARRGWRRMLMWRSLVLPNLPLGLRRRWLAWWARDGQHLPSYLRVEAMSYPALLDAKDRFLGALVHKEMRGAIDEWLSAPALIGARLAHRALAAQLGVRLVSPLVDRGVIEFVLGLPPRWVLADGVPKGLLREAWRGRLPESLRVQPKDDTMGDFLITPILSSNEAHNRLRDPVVRQRLDGWIRFDRVDGMMNRIAAGAAVRPAVLRQLEALIMFADWYARAHREFGVE